jgi:hypothetical protein
VLTLPASTDFALTVPASLIETCKLNQIEPHSYLTGVLTAIVNGHKQKDIDQLLPWNFRG